MTTMPTAVEMTTTPLVERAGWKALKAHAATMQNRQLRAMFAEDPGRGERYTAEFGGLLLDYSKNRIDDETLKLLVAVAEEAGLKARIEAMFTGEKINLTENRAVLHVALRAPKGETIKVDGEDQVPLVHAGAGEDGAVRGPGAEWGVEGADGQAD